MRWVRSMGGLGSVLFLWMAIAALLAGCGTGGGGGGSASSSAAISSTASTGGSGASGGNTQAPNFSADMFSGATESLASLRGHVVLLDFWASWCPACVDSFASLQQLAATYASMGVITLAIDGSDEESQADFDAFVQAHPEYGNIEFGYDPTGTAAGLYNVTAIPTDVVIDRRGNIVASTVGFDGTTLDAAIRQALSE